MLDRKTPPPFIHSTSFHLIDPVRQKLNNGVEVFFIPGGEQDVLKIELIFHAGRWYEKKAGASQFSANLLSKGTSTKNSFQIAQTFDRYGAHVEIHPGFDFVSVSIYTLTQYLKPVLDLFIEIISDPVFPDKELEQHKAIFIQNLKVNEEKTSFLASKAFRKKLFGNDHPYGRELEEHDVNQVQQPELLRHYNDFYNKPVVFVSGKISSDDESMIADAFGGLSSGANKAVTYQSPAALSFNEAIQKEGSVQASIRTGKKSLLRGEPDYPFVIFAAHILGGYFGSRLMKNIREEKGLTYGIYASIQPLQNESFILIGADVNKENVELTLTEIRKEIRDLRTQKISAEELETAKNHFIGSLQAEITTPFAHADKIKTIFLSGLSKNFYQDIILRINDITPEKIQDVTEQYLHEETFSSVAVG
jgi:zinc protease